MRQTKSILRAFLFSSLILLFAVTINYSCKKEYSCENCITGNHAPVAKAGRDTIIKLPSDFIDLDGSNSFDHDGRIKTYHWTKIAGPSVFHLADADQAKTKVENLQLGVYQFELLVQDDGGLSARDTVKVTVLDPLVPNSAPISNAGPDQSVNSTGGFFVLDGSASADADNNIASFSWTQIAGPAQVSLNNPGQVSTEASASETGDYRFELTVTDSAGLFSKDTIKIKVGEPEPCDFNARPIVRARLVEIGQLSEARFGLVTATAGTKILFAGGLKAGEYSKRVDIFDFVQNTWSTAELSRNERQGMVAAAVGNKILLAGGGNNDVGTVTSRIDIYDTQTESWTTAELSEAREYLSAATVGNKVVFAGGSNWIGGPYHGSDAVDIYDNSTGAWTTARLSEPRTHLSATAAGNKIYFAGGLISTVQNKISRRVDIFDALSNTWSGSEMIEPKMSHGSIFFDNKLYWASGIYEITNAGYYESNKVEIKNLITGHSETSCMGGKSQFTIIEKDNKLIFFTGYPGEPDAFDIYDPQTNKWSIALMVPNVQMAAVISVNNKIYVAGGTLFGNNYINKLWTLEW